LQLIDDEYINNCNVCLSDFGQFVEDGEYYDESFGTRYYRSPENILVGKSSFPSDIWALGCTFYEILTGRILFNPDKDKNYSRDDYHLKLINEACGDFSKDFLKSTKLYKYHFSNYKIIMNKNLDYTNKIENKLKSVLTNEDEYNIAIKLIKGMLEINPKKRLNCITALNILNN
jgi:serine/threonine protein kinase